MSAVLTPVAAPTLNALERGIAMPVIYASLFGAPVRREDLRARVVGVRANEDEIERALHTEGLRSMLITSGGDLWFRPGCAKETIDAFAGRRAATMDLLERHEDVLDFVRSLPWVHCAALSGGCAHETADDGDIDVFAVVARGALWRTLARTTLTAKIRGWRRILCLNYLVDETALELPWRDFYGGFELISLKPLRGREWIQKIGRANPWVDSIFPNFLLSAESGQNPVTEFSPGPSPGLEFLARMIHRSYLRYRLPAGSGVELSDHVVRLHTRDHRVRLKGLFQDALQRIGMELPPWI